MANKVKYGLSNVHYSIYTPAQGSTSASWATPVAWPGAVSLSLDVDGKEADFFADNTKYFSDKKDNGLTGTLEMAYLDDSIKRALLGYATVTTGTSPSEVVDLVDVADAQFAQFALLFQVSGNEENKGYVYYMCKLGKPSVAAETTGDTIDPDTVSFPITIVPVELASGKKINGREHKLAASDTWFTAAPALPTLDA